MNNKTKGNNIIPYKKPGVKSKCPSTQELTKLYENMTADEIAKMFCVSKHTVRSWIYHTRKGVSQHEKR